MSLKRIIFILIPALFLYLGLYTWNQRTDTLDRLAETTGLEVVGTVLRPGIWLYDSVTTIWTDYFDLIDVRAELTQTQKKLDAAEVELARLRESLAELHRLRAFFTLSIPSEWQFVGARVLASRLGPQGILETITLDRGYLTGGGSGVPVIATQGVVGRVQRAGPFTSTALLLIDPASRIAVVGQESRTQGILAGGGRGKPLKVRYIMANSNIKAGEVLVTSGLDGVFPKGIPVARVVDTVVHDGAMFQAVMATPVADMTALEEVILLHAPRVPYTEMKSAVPEDATQGTVTP